METLKRKTRRNLDSRSFALDKHFEGESSFEKQINDVLPKVVPEKIPERIKIYYDLREIFEDIKAVMEINLEINREFFKGYSNKSDLFFDSLYKKWGL
ncbi:hypothetical protein COU58_00005 [Candidatus Pacearchaeota archaeon CG10_big_fil_rev_8_21_14_0_10_32_42]|nr:MAG: hypothetical protein COU58_00005 [Candidatus Pacearchaeota archaeon CG10_big_fil_rev_8_21_14_0_10_32_42]